MRNKIKNWLYVHATWWTRYDYSLTSSDSEPCCRASFCCTGTKFVSSSRYNSVISQRDSEIFGGGGPSGGSDFLPQKCTSLGWRPFYWGSALSIVGSLQAVGQWTGIIAMMQTKLGPVASPFILAVLGVVGTKSLKTLLESAGQRGTRYFCGYFCTELQQLPKTIVNNLTPILIYLLLIVAVEHFIDAPTLQVDWYARCEALWKEIGLHETAATYVSAATTLLTDTILVNGIFSGGNQLIHIVKQCMKKIKEFETEANSDVTGAPVMESML